MLLKTRAIVLNSLKCSENAVIAHTYTEQHGRMSYIINGAQSKKSALRSAMLQPLSVLELETDYNPKKDLQRIKESRLAFAPMSLPYDPNKTALAIFIAELLYRSLREPHTDPVLFRFLLESVCCLDTTVGGIGNFHFTFLIQYAHFMGFAPQKENYAKNAVFDLQNGIFVAEKQIFGQYLDSYDSALFATLCNLNYQNMSELRFSKEDKKTLLAHLLHYYKLHISNFSGMKSLDILHQLFE
jgi:DNA repair protein RecO (recombination protein O)